MVISDQTMPRLDSQLELASEWSLLWWDKSSDSCALSSSLNGAFDLKSLLCDSLKRARTKTRLRGVPQFAWNAGKERSLQAAFPAIYQEKAGPSTSTPQFALLERRNKSRKRLLILIPQLPLLKAGCTDSNCVLEEAKILRFDFCMEELKKPSDHEIKNF